VDQDNKDALFRLLRWRTRNGGEQKLHSLDDYVSNMKDGQEKIFYIMAQTVQGAMTSPYMEPFKTSDIDVLILQNNVDEILFNQNSEYKGKKFVSIETSFDQIQKDLGAQSEINSLERSRIPEEDTNTFCIWLKNSLKGKISNVTISKRLTDTPAILSGNMSASMRMMMQMMESQGQMPDPAMMNKLTQDQTFELNAAHPIIVNLNQLRKSNEAAASLVAMQLLDNVCVQSGIPFDMQAGTDRQYKLLNNFLELSINQQAGGSATRATVQDSDSEPQIEIKTSTASQESAMKQAKKSAR